MRVTAWSVGASMGAVVVGALALQAGMATRGGEGVPAPMAAKFAPRLGEMRFEPCLCPVCTQRRPLDSGAQAVAGASAPHVVRIATV